VAGVRVEGLTKSFGGRLVLDIGTLEIGDGEFFSLLGPSGCGKTTTLRSIAGLADPDRGRILIGGRDVTGVPTFQRNLGMVFQNYALFPHLTVGENVAYGLRERGAAAGDISRRVGESLLLVALPGLADRYPHQLSGGQQQRVALARAVAYRPDVLLLDEPLSNLDVKLRVAMRAELKRLQRTLGITTIFVTHDQHEALALSDRIGVMRDGSLDQVGTPRDVYESPASVAVADFVGGTNLIAGVVRSGATIEVEGAGALMFASLVDAGARVTVAAKPERIALSSDAAGGLRGVVESVAYLGSSVSYLVTIGRQQIEVRCGTAIAIGGRTAQAGDAVSVIIDMASARLFA